MAVNRKSGKRPPRRQVAPVKAAGTDSASLLHFVENLKRQWVAAIDALVDPLVIISADYTIQKANLAMAQLAGASVKDVIGQRCHKVFSGRATPCPGCKLKDEFKARDSSTFALEAIRDDKYFEVTSQPLLGEHGNLEGMVHVYRDRTEAKKIQAHLAQQEKLASIGILAGGVAHEINNPLGGILIFSQMLLRELPKESPHYQDVVEIEAATQRCKAIVEGLLNFARKGPATGKPKLAEVDVIDAMRTALRFRKLGLPKSGKVELKDECGEASHRLLGDRNAIIQLFFNLIQNAIQAMPHGGTIVLRATSTDQRRGGFVGIYEVEDTGQGIPPENLTKIFDPFFTTKDPGEGTGLGLALCYRIVQDLQGVIRVESTVGVGTKFTIELPLASSKSLLSAS